MSTEAPPVLETPPPVVPPVEPPQSLIASVRVLRPAGGQPEPATPPLETPAPEPVVTPEPTPKPTEPPKVDPPKVDPPKEDPTTGLSEPAAKRFRTLEKHKVEAEQARDKFKTEAEMYQKDLEAARQQLAEMEEIKREALKKDEELKTYREQVRTINIERDPEFQRQYNGEILSRQHQLLDMAVEHGASQVDVIKAINAGDEDALEVFRESLPAAKQRIWDSNRTDIERIAYAKKEALKNASQTAEQLAETNKRRAMEEVERVKANNVTMAKQTIDHLWKTIPGMDKADASLKGEIEGWLTDQVVNAQPQQLVEQLAIGEIAKKVVEGQKGEIDRLNEELASRTKEIEELTEKLSEQETFIKEAASHSPRATPGGSPANTEQNGSLLSTVRVHVPGR